MKETEPPPVAAIAEVLMPADTPELGNLNTELWEAISLPRSGCSATAAVAQAAFAPAAFPFTCVSLPRFRRFPRRPAAVVGAAVSDVVGGEAKVNSGDDALAGRGDPKLKPVPPAPAPLADAPACDGGLNLNAGAAAAVVPAA